MKELQDKLQQEFRHLEEQWRSQRPGAKEATQATVDRLQRGETVVFLYHEWMDTDPTDNILRKTGAVGQFSFGIMPNGRVQPDMHLMHTTIPAVVNKNKRIAELREELSELW